MVSGSFAKFKPEIDRAIDQLTDLGVMVLAPDKGWLYKPPTRLYFPEDKQFRPLPSEVGMSVRQIEDSFLLALSRSDFVYVVNPGGHVGETVSMEMGFALALGIPVYLQEPVDLSLDLDPVWQETMKSLEVIPIEKLVGEVN